MSSGIDLPILLRDGSTLLMDHTFADRLRNGAPEVGWAGDDRMGVYFADGCLEIRRLGEDGKLVCIMRSKPGVRFLGTDALVFLAEHDSQSRRQYNVVEDVIAHNTALERSNAADTRARNEECADRLHFALTKDIGHIETGLTKRLHAMPRAPWKTDADK